MDTGFLTSVSRFSAKYSQVRVSTIQFLKSAFEKTFLINSMTIRLLELSIANRANICEEIMYLAC